MKMFSLNWIAVLTGNVLLIVSPALAESLPEAEMKKLEHALPYDDFDELHIKFDKLNVGNYARRFGSYMDLYATADLWLIRPGGSSYFKHVRVAKFPLGEFKKNSGWHDIDFHQVIKMADVRKVLVKASEDAGTAIERFGVQLSVYDHGGIFPDTCIIGNWGDLERQCVLWNIQSFDSSSTAQVKQAKAGKGVELLKSDFGFDSFSSKLEFRGQSYVVVNPSKAPKKYSIEDLFQEVNALQSQGNLKGIQLLTTSGTQLTFAPDAKTNGARFIPVDSANFFSIVKSNNLAAPLEK